MNFSAKVVLLGDGGTGKTSLVRRVVDGQHPQCTEMTLGVNCFRDVLDMAPFGWKGCIFQVYDTGGNRAFLESFIESFMQGPILRSAFRNDGKLSALIFGFDVTSYASFEGLPERWLSLFPASAQSACLIYLVGYKADAQAREVSREAMQALAESHPLLSPERVFEVDSATDRGVSELMVHLAMSCDAYRRCTERTQREAQLHAFERDLLSDARWADAARLATTPAQQGREDGEGGLSQMVGSVIMGTIGGGVMGGAVAGGASGFEAGNRVAGPLGGALGGTAGTVAGTAAGTVLMAGVAVAAAGVAAADCVAFAGRTSRTAANNAHSAAARLAGKPKEHYKFGDVTRRALGFRRGEPDGAHCIADDALASAVALPAGMVEDMD